MPLNIAIIGAGPGGCMLARLLLTPSPCPSSSPPTPPTITIFESESSPNYRSQGGTLDLHPSSGLLAMKRAKLYDKFLAHARFDGAALKVLDKRGTAYLSVSAGQSGNPEIDRSVLRGLLFDSLTQDYGGVKVRWGKKLLAIEEREGKDGLSSERVLKFVDGTEEIGYDLIIGADGGWSKTRRFLDPDTKPEYAGITRYWSTILNAAVKAPVLSRFVNRGNMFSFGDGKGIMAQQMGDGCLDCAVYRVEPYEENPSVTTTENVKREFGDWSEKLVAVLENCEPDMTRKPLFELPVGYSWIHRTGATLLGDAAHLMTPFAGEGVNLAFVDAMELAEAILGAKNVVHLDKNVRDFERKMFLRAKKAQAMTSGMKSDMFFTPGAPRTSIESWMLRKFSYEMTGWLGPILYPVLAAGVYTVYFFFKMFL